MGMGMKRGKVFCYGFSFSIGGIVLYGSCCRVSGKKYVNGGRCGENAREKSSVSTPPHLPSLLGL